MYTGFFGLTDVPFSIAPNPRYLYMSDRHKEALAHLTYGLGETGGFVLLTGEVGTGKTTISRCLLEDLPENTQPAFILNPTLSSQELLATICDELKIRYRKTGATLKTLTDKIQTKLLKNHANDINTVLIIDEAQHLKPEVLEQLRLLTNLETNTKKLLQVILIGQPELQQLLKRRDLRQLAQRITARYHLLPLNKCDVNLYIQHRLKVAGCNRMLFSVGAVSLIHQLSQGIPRLINLMCDRALLGAYGLNKDIVDKKLVAQASEEALGEEYQLPAFWQHNWFRYGAMVVGVVALVILLSTLVTNFSSSKQQDQALVDTLQNAEVVASVDSSSGAANVEDWAIQISESRSLPQAFSLLYSLWRIDVASDIDKPCELATEFELSCFWQKGNLRSLLLLQYPAVIKFVDNNGESFYGTLLGKREGGKKENNLILVDFAGTQRQIGRDFLEQYWQGGAVILWQAPDKFVKQIDNDSDIALIQWLENKLSFKQQRPARVVSKFDTLLVNQLEQFQRKNLLSISPSENKFADEKTVMLLSNDIASGIPIYQPE